MGFQNDEQRKASFKHVYGRAQVNPENGISAEQLETGHQIYSDELLSEANTIAYASSNPNTMTSSSIWTPSSPSNMAAVWNGSFVKTSEGGSNSNFEKVTIPLVEISDANVPRAFGALIKSGQSTSGAQTPAYFVQNATYRLRNWVTPVRFGAGYKVGVFESNTNKSGPDSTKPVGENNTNFTNKVWGGWAFDYYQGILNFANPNSGAIDTSGINFPLWLVGYRYIGPTGSAAPGTTTTTGGTGGITEITSTTPTNLSFDSETSTITIGEDSTAIGVGSLSPYKRAYYNHDFARNDIRNYSSILINSTSSATGAPYTDGADNQLIIPVIHMPIGFGFSIGFTSSNFESANLSGYKYFEHTKADKWDYHATHTSSDWLDLQYTDGANGNLPFNVRAFNQAQPSVSAKIVYRGWYKGESGNRLEFDITSKSKFEIADGLRNLINTSKCYQHVSASIHQEGSDWRLKVEQVYSGYPYASYSIKYVGSSTGSNMQPTTHSLVSSHWNTANGKAQNLWQPENMNQSSNFINWVANATIGDKVGYLGALGFSTTTDTNFSIMMSPGAGNTSIKLIEANANSVAWTCISDVTGSGYPYGNDVTLINGEVGQQNPTARSILKIHEKLVKNDLYRVGSHYFGAGQFNSDGSLNQTERDNDIAIMNDNNGFTDYVYSGDTPFIQFSDAVAAQKNNTSWPVFDIGNIIKASYTAELYDEPFYNYTGIDVTTTNPGNTQFNIIIADLTDLDTRFTGSFYLSSSTSGTSSLPAPAIFQTLKYQFNANPGIADTWNLYYPKKAFTGTYIKDSTNGSKDLLTYFPQTYNYIDPDKLALNSAGAMQTITSPLKIIGDVEIVGNLSASSNTGAGGSGGSGGGGTGAGFPFTGSAEILGTLSASGHISASSFIGDGSQLTGVATSGDYVVSSETASLSHITASGNISSSGYVSASSFIGNGSQLTGVQPPGDYLETGTNIVVASLTTTGNTKLGNHLSDKHEVTGSVEVTGSFKANKGKFGSGTVLLEWDEPGQISGSGNFRAGGNAVIKNALSSGPAILGISGSEKAAYNTGKLNDFFKATGENHYSLYVRNGLTIVGSHIVPDRPHAFDLGTKKFPFRDLHLDKSSIIFHSGSPEESGSDKPELGRLSINTASLSAEFTSGSELIKVRAGEFNLGGGIGATGDNASIQITASSNGQGFIAVNANAQGQRSTILRAEYYQLSGDMNMGSITQKGSGSFAILLDADQAKSDAKFVVESNNPVPGVGSRLFHVSESGEVRSHGYLTVSQSLEVGTSVTAQSFTGSLTNMTGTIDGGTF